MGEMADYYNEQIEEMDYQRSLYRGGLMSGIEAYEKGIIDELGYEHSGYSQKTIKCRCCNKLGLHWAQRENKFRLFEKNNKIHKCPANPLK